MGLWLWTVGICLVIGHFAAGEVIRQLVATHVFMEYPLRYIAITGYINIAIGCVLVAGAVLAAVGSDGPRRPWFVAAAIAIGVEELASFGALWLLQQVGYEITLGTVHWLTGITAFLFLAALASIAVVSRSGLGSKRLATATLWIIGARAAMHLIVAIVPATTAFEKEVLPNVEMLAAIAMWLASLAVILDLLGAFPRVERTPAALARGRATLVASAIAIVLVILGIGLTALALWSTKRMASSTPNTATFVRGTLVFFAAAMMLSRLQGRVMHAGAFVAAFVVTLIAGRRVLHHYEHAVEQVELETHQLPGVSIDLPVGETDVDYDYAELGKLSVMTHHADLGLVELSWQQADEDPMEDYTRAVHAQLEVTPITDRAGDIAVHGVVWSLPNTTSLYESWQCPNDERWFVLSISRYAPGVETLTKIASRIVATLSCGRAMSSPRFAMPAPPDFSSTWARQLDPDAVMRSAGMRAESVAASTVHAQPSPHGIVESEERTVYEQHDADAYRIAAIWHCYTLDVDVAIYAVAAPTRPRESLLAAISGAHCPR